MKNIYVIDFETYYSKDYTLSGQKGLSTSEYVRDPRFKIHGFAIQHPHQTEARWVTGNEATKYLSTIDWSTAAVLCHNTAFDGFILHEHFGIHPCFYLDTLSMSRGIFGITERHDLSALAQRLGFPPKLEGVLNLTKGIHDLSPDLEDKLAVYARHDARLTYQCFEELDKFYPEDELRIIDLTLRAFCDPKLHLNETLAKQVLHDEIETKQRLIELSGTTEKILSSNKQFAELLRSKGITPPTKWSPRTGELTYAFAKSDISFQELANDPEVEPLYKARIAAKSTIGYTRAQRLLSHGIPGPLPILMNYCAAHTMRWGGGDKMNPQNLPTKRTGDDRLRRSIIAPPGYVVVVADSSQIEARTLAWLAKEVELLDIFRSGKDPYAFMAQKIFGYEVDKKSTERQLGKTAVLGLGYGMGPDKFQMTVESGLIGPPMELAPETAERIVKVYRATNPHICHLWKVLDTGLSYMILGEPTELYGLLFDGTEIRMPNGLSLHYPELKAKYDSYRYFDFSYKARDGVTRLWGAKLTENIIQCLARIIVAQQALKVAEKYSVVLLVHDEVVFLAKESEAEEACAYGIECLSTPVSWCPDIPVAAEGGYATNYSK